MESSAFLKKENGVESAKICRRCMSTGDALEALTRDESGQFTGLQIEFSPGIPSYLCTMCGSRLKKMDLLSWRCNEKNDLVELIEQQNTAKNESETTHDHLAHEQTVGTEILIKTEVTSPDVAKDLHLNQECCTVHQANRTYECCGHIPDDLFEVEENPIAIKSEYEEVYEQHELQTTNAALDHEQDNLKSHCKNQSNNCPHSSMFPLDDCCRCLKIHIRERPYQCKICDKAFHLSSTLANHTKIHNKDQQYHCPHCSSMFAQSSSLQIHIRTHTGERPFQCKVCNKAFRSPSNLAQHSKRHNKDQQHQCPHCSSAFALSSSLKIHIRTHTGEKPYVCKICDKAFHSSRTLAQHWKIHNKDQYLQCPHCSSMFAHSSSLKIHIRTHTGEKPYVCKVCDKAYRASGNLTEHSKTHNKDQYLQCPHCPSMFAHSSSLKIHIRTHTGEKPYVCRVCDKAFRKSGNLVRHSKIHKKDESH